MIMAIPYKDYSGDYYYLYDDAKMTEEEAIQHLKSEDYTPYGFSISKEHYHNIVKNICKGEEE